MKDKGTIYTYTIDDLVTGLNRMLTAIGKADKVFHSAIYDQYDGQAPEFYVVWFEKGNRQWKFTISSEMLKRNSFASMMYMVAQMFEERKEADTNE